MKKLLLFLIFNSSFLIYCSAQQASKYTITIQVQYKDTTLYCDCPQDNNTEDYGSSNVCDPIPDVMINVYSDTNLIQTLYADHNGYCPAFQLPYNKYKLVLHAKNYDETAIALDFTGTDRRNTAVALNGNPIHCKSDGTAYFISVIMNGLGKKHGVKIVPK